jgi:quinohemoprotein ethanol dehydrogenase
MGYDAQTGLMYIPAYETLGSGAAQGALAQGKLVAYDPIKQQPRWVATVPLSINGGVLPTAGNLVFFGDASGDFSAYAADTGKRIWSVKTGSAIQSVPVSYVVNGEQYVLMPIGLGGGFRLFGRVSDMATLETKRGPAGLLAFKLGGKAAMPPIQAYIPAVPKPPEQTASRKRCSRASAVQQFFCRKCHFPEADGSGAWALDGEVPDLRYMPLSVHRRFNASVLGGSNKTKGMPGFGAPPGWPWINTGMTQEEADALHAYLIDVQWKTYTEGPRGSKKPEK